MSAAGESGQWRWKGTAGYDPGCVKTLRGMIAPEILRRVVMFRAKKCRNSSSARHDDQIRFRFHTTKTQGGSRAAKQVIKSAVLTDQIASAALNPVPE